MFKIDPNYEHWSKTIAKRAISQFGDLQVVCAGWSPSGIYHIGNSREAVTCNAFNLALQEEGSKSKFVFVIDNFDPLDKTPVNLKMYRKELDPYLGHPINRIPDPTGETESYANLFAQGAIQAMEDFHIETEFVYAADLYKKGKYDEFLRIYLSKSDELDHLFENISGSPLKSYISVVCPNCGNLKTTNVQEINSSEISVKCETEGRYKGCDTQSTVKFTSHEWKLKWRLDWPARQSFLNVTIEPSGKDHSVAGGSVDTAIAIHKDIFEKKPPLLERYGFITLGGKKFSGSKGGALAADQVASIMPPSAYLYLIYRSDMLKDFDFNPQSLEYAKLIDEFDVARSMALGKTFHGREREAEKLSAAARLAMSKGEKGFYPSGVKFEELAWIYQTSLRDKLKTIEKIRHLDKIRSKKAETELVNRLYLLDFWLDELAPNQIKFSLRENPPKDITSYWSDNIVNVWLSALDGLPKNATPNEISSALRDAGKETGVSPKEYFMAFYQLYLGQSSGPNAANLVNALGPDVVRKRIAELY